MNREARAGRLECAARPQVNRSYRARQAVRRFHPLVLPNSPSAGWRTIACVSPRLSRQLPFNCILPQIFKRLCFGLWLPTFPACRLRSGVLRCHFQPALITGLDCSGRNRARSARNLSNPCASRLLLSQSVHRRLLKCAANLARVAVREIRALHHEDKSDAAHVSECRLRQLTHRRFLPRQWRPSRG